MHTVQPIVIKNCFYNITHDLLFHLCLYFLFSFNFFNHFVHFSMLRSNQIHFSNDAKRCEGFSRHTKMGYTACLAGFMGMRYEAVFHMGAASTHNETVTQCVELLIKLHELKLEFSHPPPPPSPSLHSGHQGLL